MHKYKTAWSDFILVAFQAFKKGLFGWRCVAQTAIFTVES